MTVRAAEILRAAAVACLVAAGPAASQEGPAGVVTAPVERREVSETVPVFAEIVATRESEVAVRVAGVVTELRVGAGAQVAEGDVIAVLDRQLLEIERRSAEAALAEAKAGIRVAEADLRRASQALARVEGLRGTNAFGQGTFDDRASEVARAEGGMAEAEARRLAAEAALARATYDLDRAEVTAPFDATVLAVRIDPGEYVQVGASVALLLDTSRLEVEANVPARFVGGLEPGLTLTAHTETGAELAVTLRAVLPTENTATRTRPVRFASKFTQSGAVMAVGQSLTIEVPRGAPETVTLVPKDAVAQSRGAWTVFVNEGGTAAQREVEIGRSFGPAFEVITGLAEGDEVVIRGNERLRPGQPIAPSGAPDAAPEGDPAAGPPPTAERDESEAAGAARGGAATPGSRRLARLSP